MTNDIHRIHAIIHGIVQGVGFRYHTQVMAQRLGAVGWVRNLPDGTVEVVAEGSKKTLEQLADFLQHGPPHAVVRKVDLRWSEPTLEYDQFTVKR
ncbi:MAG: acylphosphatase [Phototrophicales bacterium]|nr:MAG: acylphosphatase [Phototrophicales bacterium]